MTTEEGRRNFETMEHRTLKPHGVEQRTIESISLRLLILVLQKEAFNRE
jgi:hypothetical protein